MLNVISVSELFFQAKSAAGTYYRYFEVYFIIAVIYLILTLHRQPHSARRSEKKMDGPDNYVIHGSQSDSRADIKRDPSKTRRRPSRDGTRDRG